jgi:ubiquinol-cytochrome c reductase cytochrome b subunit
VPVVGKQIARFILGGDTARRRDAEPLLRHPRVSHPGDDLRFLGLHLILVMRHGISEPPKPGELVDPKTYRRSTRSTSKDGVPFWPDAAWRDVVFGVAMAMGILGLAIFVGPPPLDAPPDPSIITADPRPDWYLLWYFAVLALLPAEPRDVHHHPRAAPRRRVLALLAPILSNKGERSARRRPWAIGHRGR